jgi:sugar fermentation stimulation protein A
MKFKQKLITGKILKRYKRFLADVELREDAFGHKKGEIITAHTANTGSMTTCWEPGWKVALSYHDNPARKLKFSLELTHNGNTWIGVNTSLTNKLVHEALQSNLVPKLKGYQHIKPEVKVGDSRIDFILYNGDTLKAAQEKCYIEVKNVTLLAEENVVSFPDGVSTRGQKHLRELMELKKQGHRACMFYVVQREDCKSFRPANEIDPEYARLLKEAKDAGVEIFCYKCEMKKNKVEIKEKLRIKI